MSAGKREGRGMPLYILTLHVKNWSPDSLFRNVPVGLQNEAEFWLLM